MATVNKDFKIKNGLVVEGTNATVNGNNILTETASDQYIIDLIGGETLITSVDSTDFTVNQGNLEISVASDIARDGDITSAIDALTTSDIEEGTNQYFTTARIDSHLSGGDGITYSSGTISADVAEGLVISPVSGNIVVDRTTTDTWYDASGAAATAETNANSYTDGRETAITAAYESYADTAEADARSYADSLIDDASTTTTNNWSAYKTSTEIGLAQAAAEQHADDAIAALVDSAPATLDTLNELAAALQDNPDIISDLQDIASGKQDTLTAGDNIDITGSTISVTGLDTEDVAEAPAGPLYFTDSRATDAVKNGLIGQAAAGYQAVSIDFVTGNLVVPDLSNFTTDNLSEGINNLYYTDSRVSDAINNSLNIGGAVFDAIENAVPDNTDGLSEGANNLYFTDARAKTSAIDLLTSASTENITIVENLAGGLTITAENGVADSTTDDLTEGSSNLYFTDSRAVDALEAVVPNFTEVDINSLAKQIAATVSAPTAASQITAYSWAKADYRSAKFLIKTAYGTHTELTEVLITLDSSDNIAITEYATVGTNGSSMTVTADVSGTDVRLRVTPTNNNSTVSVVGTLLA